MSSWHPDHQPFVPICLPLSVSAYTRSAAKHASSSSSILLFKISLKDWCLLIGRQLIQLLVGIRGSALLGIRATTTHVQCLPSMTSCLSQAQHSAFQSDITKSCVEARCLIDYGPSHRRQHDTWRVNNRELSGCPCAMRSRGAPAGLATPAKWTEELGHSRSAACAEP